MNKDRSRNRAQPPDPGRDSLTLAERCKRGEALRLQVEEVIAEMCPMTSIYSDEVSRQKKGRIRNQARTKVAREQMIPVDELVKDVDLAEAIDLIGLYLGKEAVNAILVNNACLTQERVIRLAHVAWGGRSASD
jgi:hypothetical protein